MAPGERRMPTPMVPPTITAIPKGTPRMRRSLFFPANGVSDVASIDAILTIYPRKNNTLRKSQLSIYDPRLCKLHGLRGRRFHEVFTRVRRLSVTLFTLVLFEKDSHRSKIK